MTNKKRVFLGVWEIAGYFHNLALGLRELGYEVTYLDLGDNPFKYVEREEFFANVLKKIHRRYRSSRNLFGRLGWGVVAFLGRCLFIIWVILTCDVLIFGFGQSFFRNYELPLLRLLMKKVICFVGFGSEARPPYLDGSHLRPDGSHPSFDYYAGLVKKMKGNLQRIEKSADYIIASPQTDHFLQRQYISMPFLGMPYQKQEHGAVVVSQLPSDTVHVLHAPSNEIVKGSSVIRDTIKRLKARGYPIVYTEISGKPNSVVMQELGKCDFVIDQVYSDTPLASFASEAAWFAKPAIVGGYLWKLLPKVIPPELLLVSEICHPNDMEQTVERFIVDLEYREEMGRRARQFVEIIWNRRLVSEKFAQLIEGRIVEEWWRSPHDHPVNVYGCGLPEEKAKQLIRFMVQGGGVSALGVNDKPEVEKDLLQFARQE